MRIHKKKKKKLENNQSMTQVTPNKHNSKSHNSVAVGQWRRRWPTYSPLDLHITPIHNYNHPFSKKKKIYNIPSTISNNYGLYSRTNFYSLHITTTTYIYLAFSNGSVSDEDDDSLIEICLPGSKSGGLDEKVVSCGLTNTNLNHQIVKSLMR